MFRYFASLTTGRIVLWCYLIWYIVTVVNHFDRSPGVWLNAVGVSAVVGVALLLSVDSQGSPSADRWQTIRLFLMPFCVSSFSSLIKDQGYIFIVPRHLSEQVTVLSFCGAFVLFVGAMKHLRHVAVSGRGGR
jgi:hypothetical protein